MSTDILLYAWFGGILQELLHWYELRLQLSEDKYSKLLSSIAYWVIVVATVLCGGVFTGMWLNHLQNVQPVDAVIFGASFPLIFKKMTSTYISKEQTRLGNGKPQFARWYFTGE